MAARLGCLFGKDLGDKSPVCGILPDLIGSRYPAVSEAGIPLPRHWNAKDKYAYLGLSQSNLRVHYKGLGKNQKDAASVRANHPIPAACGVYYFELKVVSKGRDGYIGIGLSTSAVNINRLPGWEKNSYGYHGDDGHTFCSSGMGQTYGPTFTTGDVVGCCLNLIDNTCFFTKNGVNLGIVFRNLPPNLYPTVGLQTPGEIVEANFGQSPFVFDIDDYMQEWKMKTTNEIGRFSVTNKNGEWELALQKIWNLMCYSKNIQIVYSYLIHNGYCSTAEAFSRFTKQSYEEDIASIRNRQKIQRLILCGRIGEAISTTMTLYPDLFTNNPNLLFSLKCRQFIEMINGAEKAESSSASTPKPTPCVSAANAASCSNFRPRSDSGSHSDVKRSRSRSPCDSDTRESNGLFLNNNYQDNKLGIENGVFSNGSTDVAKLDFSNGLTSSNDSDQSTHDSCVDGVLNSNDLQDRTVTSNGVTLSQSSNQFNISSSNSNIPVVSLSSVSVDSVITAGTVTNGSSKDSQENIQSNSQASNGTTSSTGDARNGEAMDTTDIVSNGHGLSNNDCSGLGSSAVSNGTSGVAVNGGSDSTCEDMDIDADVEKVATLPGIDVASSSTDGTNSLYTNGDCSNGAEKQSADISAAGKQSADVSAVDDSTELSRKRFDSMSQSSLESLLEFGREIHVLAGKLHREHGPNETNDKILRDAFSLLAYSDPWNSCVGYQLNPVQREPLCAALNSAILDLQGLPKQPPLELAISHSQQCIKLMAKAGLSSCAFVNIADYLYPKH